MSQAKSCPRNTHVLFALAAVLLLLSFTCRAEGEPRRAKIAVLVRSVGAAGESSLDSLIADSISTELEAKGLVAERLPGGPADLSLPAIKESTAADFALLGQYALDGTTISLAARWVDLSSLHESQQASRRGELDLSFDGLVAGLVDELVAGQAASLAALPPAEAPPETPVAEAQPVRAAVPEAPAAVETAPAPARPPLAPLAPLAFSAGAAPFIATFTAMNYFPLGLSAWVSGRYQLRAAGGFLGLGLVTGVSAFHGRGQYAQADFYIVPVGADAVYGTLAGGPLDFFVHAGGGPAVLMAQPSSGNLLAKVIPFLTGGVGFTWTPIEVLALSADASYTCFFDSSAAIMGFTPSVALVLKL